MKENNHIEKKMKLIDSVREIAVSKSIQSADIKELKKQSALVEAGNYATHKNNSTLSLFQPAEAPVFNKHSSLLYRTLSDKKSAADNIPTKNLFRFFVKNGEHVYGRANDIIMMESCDHLVNVYLAVNDKIKKTIRSNTLKDFLSLLPADQFIRIGRFCAINIQRLSGGNFNEQTFEFDFKVSVKIKHPIPLSVFKNIGK
jgi:DNA-binding LytR/AlgR family response regulator